MMYKNFKVVMDKLAALSQSSDASSDRRLETQVVMDRLAKIPTEPQPDQQLETANSAVLNSGPEKIEVSAEVKVAIEAQQSENKIRMAEIKAQQTEIMAEIKAEIKAQQTEIKAEIKAQQTESNRKLNALEAMVAQLIEQNKQLLGSIGGKDEKWSGGQAD